MIYFYHTLINTSHKRGKYYAKKTNKTRKTGEYISDNASKVANLSSIIAFITNEDIRMGASGIALIIGLFMVNMLFAFIIIENMIFMGVALLIFPILAVCYVFEQTRSYATAGLSKLFTFAKGLIFMCIAIVICNEINDWVLGGIFSSPNETNISSTKYALTLLKEGEIDKFNEIVGDWYFLYVIFALTLNFKLIKEEGTFAGWFGGSVSESGLGQSVWSFSKSIINKTKSVGRDAVKYINSKDSNEVNFIDKFKFVGKKIKDKFSSGGKP